MARLTVRRIRLHEWEQVRHLRVEAVSDPDAAIAFLTTAEQETAREDRFWRDRAAGFALSETTAQFVAVADDRWVGTATVLVRAVGTVDQLDRVLTVPRADIVGVYIAPAHRGRGILPWLFDEARVWAFDRGAAELTLDVHVDNARAQAAYRRAGFVPTGTRFASPIGPQIEMRWSPDGAGPDVAGDGTASSPDSVAG